MPDVAEDPWGRAIGNFRDVTRWIIAGIAGAVSLILGTSPLIGLGGLGIVNLSSGGMLLRSVARWLGAGKSLARL